MSRRLNPATVAKAARLTVVPRNDGSFHVGGDTAIYTVRLSPFTLRWYCDCRAGHAGCSHTLAVHFHEQRNADKQKEAI